MHIVSVFYIVSIFVTNSVIFPTNPMPIDNLAEIHTEFPILLPHSAQGLLPGMIFHRIKLWSYKKRHFDTFKGIKILYQTVQQNKKFLCIKA